MLPLRQENDGSLEGGVMAYIMVEQRNCCSMCSVSVVARLAFSRRQTSFFSGDDLGRPWLVSAFAKDF